MNKFLKLPLIGIALSSSFFSSTLFAKENKKIETDSSTKIHAVCDLAHAFSFYGDGRFRTQYLQDHKMVTNWGTLNKFDATDANLLVFLACSPQLTYTADDIAYINEFLSSGGAVLVLGTADDKGQSKLAQQFGAKFAGKATPPLGATEKLGKQEKIEGDKNVYLELDTPAEWTVFVEDAQGRPVLAQRNQGKGTVIVGSRALAGNRPDAKDNINSSWIPRILEQAVVAKPITDGKKLKSKGLTNQGNTKKVGGTIYHYSDYLAPYFDAMVAIDKKCRPLIEKRMGVPLSKGMAGEVGLLSTGGGGFSSGNAVGLAVFWGGFPEKQDSMVEFLTHESVHSWVLPYGEVWNEPIATYVGNLVMCDAGYAEEGMRRIENTIKRASKIDSSMKLYDIGGKSTDSSAAELNAGEQRNMHWGKSFWVLEEMRKQDPVFLAKYFQAKRKYATPGIKYDMNNTVAIISQALDKDMFPWFNEHGMPVSWDKVTVKVPVHEK